MNLLHLQQVLVVAHTTHNRLSPDLTRPDLSLDLTPPPQPNQPPPHTRLHVTQPHSTLHPIHATTKAFYSSIHIHLHINAYTFNCKQIINFIHSY